ncbi:HNH endonuclease [Klebsiella aerogenes]
MMNKIYYLKPVEFSKESQDYIDKYDLKSYKVWNDKIDEMAKIKKELKVHLKKQQKKKCVYCRVNQHSNYDQNWDVEHVLPKKKYPQFLFCPTNLALACKECNRGKYETDILMNREGVDLSMYPEGARNYTIIHPFYDDYGKHLKIERSGERYLYTPLSKKGLKTYAVCNLKRYAISELIDMDSNEDVGDLFERIINMLKENSDSPVNGVVSSLKVQQKIKQDPSLEYFILPTDFEN